MFYSSSKFSCCVHGTLEIAENTNFKKSLLQIGAKLYNKLGNVLLPIGAGVVINWSSFFIKNWGKCYYKLGQLNYYKSGQVLLQIRAAIKN